MSEVESWKEAFALFDRDGDGSISVDELGTVFRALGQNPTQAEVEDIKSSVSSGTVDFETFKTLMNKHKKDPPLEQDIRTAFKVFDREGKGVISSVELRNILTTMGEKLQDDEVDGILKAVERDGKVAVTDLVQILMKPQRK
eukprot:CAMPEP_0168524188 /NCGR_PEP_ID=MMETSP0405-20121227/10486_1 /TAXON_ID=498012 /ORGANISM="Trichosphaerium sp, Strain Am-I-7 wt" /LENGTH=141 /DNA_ID=CAMNT_0008546317 /DNA_START=1 /DNA_END=426 /DNA_ORIENTATION=-